MPGVATGINTSGLKFSFVPGVARTMVGIFAFGGLLFELKLEIQINASTSLFFSKFLVEFLPTSCFGKPLLKFTRNGKPLCHALKLFALITPSPPARVNPANRVVLVRYFTNSQIL